ncbi:uncharacterized protein LY79DRAFT_573028 [Colletotrichum navitas]|uniref:DUF7908 domain-containing protein n=1 Tax=Colletotrichum navitas TaxID=681940 RepID=A0AAD8PKG5_9PEZI|nr:uncharacterized protein LY79DRAFT_573028 [Colletotrichum navitas]KAK1565961.1 hypothetical protein LY79DRAFT_573028 [Colletotrichum navitas]
MGKRHILFVLSLIARFGTAALDSTELIRALPEAYCFTYLSTFLQLVPLPTSDVPPGAIVTVIGGTTVTIPAINSTVPDTVTVIGGTTVTVTGSGTTLTGSRTTVIDSRTTVTGSGSTVTGFGTTVTTTITSRSSASASATSSSVIFFINPMPVITKRGLQKRDYGGFLNNKITSNRGSCSFATIFTISLGKLLDAGNPIFYSPSEAYKELRNTGVPPANTITDTFDDNNGVLRFTNPSLPNGQANFCQVSTGQVYLTFNSTGPAGCQPVLLYAYRTDECVNGQIVGALLPTGSFLLPPSLSTSSVTFTGSALTSGSSTTTLSPSSTTSGSLAFGSSTASVTSTSTSSASFVSSGSSPSTSTSLDPTIISSQSLSSSSSTSLTISSPFTLTSISLTSTSSSLLSTSLSLPSTSSSLPSTSSSLTSTSASLTTTSQTSIYTSSTSSPTPSAQPVRRAPCLQQTDPYILSNGRQVHRYCQNLYHGSNSRLVQVLPWNSDYGSCAEYCVTNYPSFSVFVYSSPTDSNLCECWTGSAFYYGSYNYFDTGVLI